MKMNWQKIALFLSGSFFCGAISHLVLAIINSPITHFNVPLGVAGNWILAGFDTAMTVLLYVAHRRLEKK